VPAHQRQRIAHCDPHNFPPRTGFLIRLVLVRLARLEGDLLPPAANRAAAS